MPPHYDSLIGKLIVHAPTRAEALARLRRALDETVVGGVETTLPLHRRLAANADIAKGDYDIHWLEKFLGMKNDRLPRMSTRVVTRVLGPPRVSRVFGPNELLDCYRRGVFPMADARDDPRLFLVDPDLRGVLPLDRLPRLEEPAQDDPARCVRDPHRHLPSRA